MCQPFDINKWLHTYFIKHSCIPIDCLVVGPMISRMAGTAMQLENLHLPGLSEPVSMCFSTQGTRPCVGSKKETLNRNFYHLILFLYYSDFHRWALSALHKYYPWQTCGYRTFVFHSLFTLASSPFLSLSLAISAPWGVLQETQPVRQIHLRQPHLLSLSIARYPFYAWLRRGPRRLAWVGFVPRPAGHHSNA